MRKLLSFYAGVVFFLTSCTPVIHLHPISVGSVAVVCKFPRKYYTHASVTAAEKEALLAAISETEEITPGLVVYSGEVSTDEAMPHIEAGDVVLIGNTTRYDVRDPVAAEKNRGVLAVTLIQTEKPSACLKGTPIILIADTTTFPRPELIRSLIFHEFLHSLGFGHADVNTGFSTLMRPAMEGDTPDHFTGADRRAIQSTYSRGFW